MEVHMFSSKHRFTAAFLAVTLTGLMFFTSTAMALTTGSISGKVIDERTGEALPGTNVFIKGTSLGAATGQDGSFTISNVPPGNHVVSASFIGYRSQDIEVNVVVNEVSNISLSLKEDVFRGEDVIVTGIASRTSKAVAEVAVARISASEYTVANTYNTASQLINGKIAGVNVKTSSGNVGSGFRFNVRSGGGLNGQEQPVIYIDGVRIENSEIGNGLLANDNSLWTGGQGVSMLADLNPEDIENIEVLKGPAAAASYGTNGANGVVLITTKKGRLTAGGSRGYSINYKVVRGWNKQSFDYSADDFVSAPDANRIFRTGSIIQNSISVAGGSNTVRYFGSFDSRIEDGITRNNHGDRKNVRVNFDVVPNDKLTFRANAGYTYNVINRPQNDNNTLGYLGNTLLFPTSYLFTDSTAIESLNDETKSNRFIGSVQAEWNPFRGFTGRLTLGIDDHDLRQDQTSPLDQDFSGTRDQGRRDIFSRRSTLYTYNLDGRYTFNPTPNLSVSAVGGVQMFDRRVSTLFAGNFDFLTALITNIGAGQQNDTLDEEFAHRREAGIFGEASASFRGQYFVTVGLRRDYASVVGEDSPSIVYPKASLALRLDKYAGFPGFFNLLKLRAAYGETGVLPNLLDGIPLLFTAETGGAGSGGVLGQIGNEDIKPERVKEIEFGFDAEFLDHYALEFTYYRQKAEDSIIAFRNSPSTGQTVTAKPFNVGELDGWGIESLLQASLFRSRNAAVDITLINNFQDNEVKDLGGAQPIFDAFDNNVIKEGLSKHEFFLQDVIGAEFDENGVYVGPKLTEERLALGNPVPNYTGSFSLNVRLFKNLNVYALADWATGLSIINSTRRFAVRFGNDVELNALSAQLSELTPGTAEYNDVAVKVANLDGNTRSNFIEDADFLKLREISVSYSLRDVLPSLQRGTNFLSDIIVALSATNLWTTTKYSGPDPEVNFRGARDLTRGQDFLTLQSPRTYNLSVRFSL